MKSLFFPLALFLLALAGGEAQSQSAPPTVRFQFREPHHTVYQVEDNRSSLRSSGAGPEWLKARPEDGSTNQVELGRRVVLQLKSAGDLERVLKQSALRLSRTIMPTLLILQADDAWSALAESQRLATLPEVLASYPVTRRTAALHGAYSDTPNDPYFSVQWYLERRDTNGAATGMDLNVRAAWPSTRGAGITLAVADLGVELTHPELAPRAVGAPHHNFNDDSTNALPAGGSPTWAHATEVAGLAVAQANNSRGMAGVAPEAQLASWVIFTTNLVLVSDEQLMEMYQYASNIVSVQNHSWGHPGLTQLSPGLLEQIGLSNAVSFGRKGAGVVMVRSAGNDRGQGANANDDGYSSDPRVVAVGAARFDGRVASYSEPGACLLVAAPSGDRGLPTLFTTDLVGARGVNQIHFFGDTNLWDYAFDALGFTGTSASTPLVAGVAALILSANPNLTYRDVQQILILSARHFDLADPDLSTNGAGFRVSHNQGFGVPDAGWAVTLARSWSNRPPQTSVTLTATNPAAIPDDGLRLIITGEGVPANLSSIRALAGTGPHPDVPSASAPLVDVGLATNLIAMNLTGKAALIQRGTNLYPEKIAFAAQAGAAFAVIYNYSAGNTDCPGGDELCWMGGTDFTSIPAVFIGHTDGDALRTFFQTNTDAHAQLRLTSTNYTFALTNTLICEHVAVRVVTDHPLRGDLRITLVSPQGARSVLQSYNADTSAGPVDWTYYSTHHFYESSAGNWTVYFSDEFAGNTGAVQTVSLTVEGVPIVDSDGDGLDDGWEIAHFGSLAYGPKDDPDRDGYTNAREQILGTDPLVSDTPFALDLSRWNRNLARLSWPGVTNRTYQVWSGANVASLLLLTNVPGNYPVTEWFTPYPRPAHQFFQVRTTP